MDKIMIDKIMEEIEKDHFGLYEKALAVMDVCKKGVIRQVDKLTVIDWEDVNLCGIKHIVMTEDANAIKEAQLQHTKKQLLDFKEE